MTEADLKKEILENNNFRVILDGPVIISERK
jgi:hypothetical protein